MKIVILSKEKFEEILEKIDSCKEPTCFKVKTFTDIIISITQGIKIIESVINHKNANVSLYLHDIAYLIDSSTSRERILNILAKINYDICSKRTKAALQRRRVKGLPLGRPRGGENRHLKLDKHHDDICNYLQKKIPKSSIARILNCSIVTLSAWMKKRGVSK